MTLAFYKAEEQRLLNTLSNTDPRGPEYSQVLKSIADLRSHAIYGIDTEERLRFYEIEQMEDEQKAKVVELRPAPETLPVTVPDETEGKLEGKSEPEVAYTLDAVKAEFTDAAKQGIKVADIINEAGYAKLSDVPQEKYPALMTALAVKRTEAQA